MGFLFPWLPSGLVIPVDLAGMAILACCLSPRIGILPVIGIAGASLVFGWYIGR